MAERYPKPGPVGGKLIRQSLALLQQFEALPDKDSHILIACSGGADSMALARLLLRYGRRIAPPRPMRLLHFNHRWRGEESDQDARFVEEWASRWGVPFHLGSGRPGQSGPGRSPEEDARLQRKSFFAEMRQRFPGVVLTGHHADDLAETVLWRLLSGADSTQRGGVEVLTADHELRPLLRARKSELERFLLEEGVSWRNDATNWSPRLLRASLRAELMPQVERLFPRAVPYLVEDALRIQRELRRRTAGAGEAEGEVLAAVGGVLADAGVRLRRVHWEALRTALFSDAPARLQRSVALPGGWELKGQGVNQVGSERWVLEKVSLEK